MAAQSPIDPTSTRPATGALESSDGIILLRASSGLKHWDESGFHQDASFYYFTGLANLHGAILALDGTQNESWLFIPPRPGSFGVDLHAFDSAFLDPGSQTEAELKLDLVVLVGTICLFRLNRATRAIPNWSCYMPTALARRDRCQATPRRRRDWAQSRTLTYWCGQTCSASVGATLRSKTHLESSMKCVR